MDTFKRVAMRVADIIPGGKADDVPLEDFDPDALEQGVKVEMEHTNDPAIAEEIARDHLTEFDDYYDALNEMEKRLEERVSTNRRRLFKVASTVALTLPSR